MTQVEIPSAAKADEAVQVGALARASGKEYPMEILQSVAGFYLGTYSYEDGPYTRESMEYWPTREKAKKAWDEGRWTQRTYL